MTPKTRPGFTLVQSSIVFFVMGLLGEMSPGFSHDFPGGGGTFLALGLTFLSAGLIRRRWPAGSRIVLTLGVIGAALIFIVGCLTSPLLHKTKDPALQKPLNIKL